MQFLLLSFFMTRIVSLKLALALLLRQLPCQVCVALAGNDTDKSLFALVLTGSQMQGRNIWKLSQQVSVWVSASRRKVLAYRPLRHFSVFYGALHLVVSTCARVKDTSQTLLDVKAFSRSALVAMALHSCQSEKLTAGWGLFPVVE